MGSNKSFETYNVILGARTVGGRVGCTQSRDCRVYALPSGEPPHQTMRKPSVMRVVLVETIESRLQPLTWRRSTGMVGRGGRTKTAQKGLG